MYTLSAFRLTWNGVSQDLKNVLSSWKEKCNGCTSKADYIKRIEELKPKYAKKAAEKKEL